MTPGPRQLAYASCEVAICQAVPPHMRSGVREIIKLTVDKDHRGEGHAKALLADLAQEADQRRIVLMLIVQPFDEDGYADIPALERLYASVGFKTIQTEPVVMMARQWARKVTNHRLHHAIHAVLH